MSTWQLSNHRLPDRYTHQAIQTASTERIRQINTIWSILRLKRKRLKYWPGKYRLSVKRTSRKIISVQSYACKIPNTIFITESVQVTIKAVFWDPRCNLIGMKPIKISTAISKNWHRLPVKTIYTSSRTTTSPLFKAITTLNLIWLVFRLDTCKRLHSVTIKH